MSDIKKILAPLKNSFLTGRAYSQRWLCDAGNNISDVILSEVWVTGVTIGLVKKLAVRLKTAIIPPKKKPERSQSRFIGTPTEKPELPLPVRTQTGMVPTVAEPSGEKNKTLLGLSEEAKSFEEDLTEVEETIAEMERQMRGR